MKPADLSYLIHRVEKARKAVRIAESRRPRIKGELPDARKALSMAVAKLAAARPAKIGARAA